MKNSQVFFSLYLNNSWGTFELLSITPVIWCDATPSKGVISPSYILPTDSSAGVIDNFEKWPPPYRTRIAFEGF